jgi:hypothetical protein
MSCNDLALAIKTSTLVPAYSQNRLRAVAAAVKSVRRNMNRRLAGLSNRLRGITGNVTHLNRSQLADLVSHDLFGDTFTCAMMTRSVANKQAQPLLGSAATGRACGKANCEHEPDTGSGFGGTVCELKLTFRSAVACRID